MHPVLLNFPILNKLILIQLWVSVLLVQLDDWVLCRIYNKKGSSSLEKHSMKPAETSKFQSSTSDMAAYLDTSDSVPKLHTDSSCSEQVVSPGLREVESQPKVEWENTTTGLEYQQNYMDATADNNSATLLYQQTPQSTTVNYEMAQWQDVFMYLQRSL